tara:strand:+ start:8128 stop:8337 length:210 start_codon:yes stop_codon:yes gene_type:complete
MMKSLLYVFSSFYVVLSFSNPKKPFPRFTKIVYLKAEDSFVFGGCDCKGCDCCDKNNTNYNKTISKIIQ